MREIKFRAWDKKRKLFISNDLLFVFANCPIYSQIDRTITLKNGLQNPYRESDIKNELEMDLVYMQFTGLKDKNGKEIYEMDVVIQEKGTPYENIFLVEYGHGQFKINQNTNIFQTTEVIGNIYENPKLLENNIK